MALLSKIQDLVESHFKLHLDDSVFGNASNWEKLEVWNHSKTVVIPLPASNTPAAKRMRIAAVIGAIAHSLSEHIFRPVYLLDNDTELSTLLSYLAIEKPGHEEYLRRVLLAASSQMHKANVTKRIQLVVDEVNSCITPLLGSAKSGHFSSRLETLCKQAAEDWQVIQRLGEKIEPFFGQVHEDIGEEWNVISLHPCEEALKKSPAATGVGNNKASKSSASTTTTTTGNDKSKNQDRIHSIIWPSMRYAYPGEEDGLLTPGLVLTIHQVQAAKDETNPRRSAPHAAARQATRKPRAKSVVGETAKGNSGNRFLSEGSGTDSKGG
jgi:hypothetical protein